MPLRFRFAELEASFAEVRRWAKKPFDGILNRCAICMGYTVGLKPKPGDATLADIPGAQQRIQEAWPLATGGNFSPGAAKTYFVRASELLPRMIEAYGQPDVTGVSSGVWPMVVGQKGVLYLEDCYQTDGDKVKAQHMRKFLVGTGALPPIFALGVTDRMFTNGDHWDLFNGNLMVAEGYPLANNAHAGQLYFWRAQA